MEFVVPLLIVVLVIAIGLVIMRLAARNKPGRAGQVRSRRANPHRQRPGKLLPKPAARLNQQQHTAIYALIAQGQALSAIREYRNATGAGLREAAGAVAQMSAHPQPYKASPDEAPTVRPEDEELGEPAPEQPREERTGRGAGTAAGGCGARTGGPRTGPGRGCSAARARSHPTGSAEGVPLPGHRVQRRHHQGDRQHAAERRRV